MGRGKTPALPESQLFEVHGSKLKPHPFGNLGQISIHVVLAAQNPTFQNMKVDLGNITARIAFKCAKKNFSETILGEGGAENLLGRGDLLLRSPRFDGPQRIQGIYITPDELCQMIQHIKARPCVSTNRLTLAVSGRDLAGPLGS